MSYDEPDHEEEPPTEPEPPAGSTPAVTFTLTLAREEIVQLAAERLFAQLNGYDERADMRSRVNDALQELVRETVKEHVERLTEEAVKAALSDALTNGWPKTNQYGQETGRVKVKDLALEHLIKVDGYDRENVAQKLAKKIFEETFKKELQPLVDEAKQRVKGALNNGIEGALRKALLEGAGLRG